jgi:molybdate/tungstate transport system ATP-binding protein
VLELTGLSKSYDGFAFGPVDLAVGAEVLSVLGPSGSGKTTLLSLIAGTVRPDAGSVSLDGRRLDGRPVEARGTGLVFQDGALFPHLTARGNVGYAATGPDRVEELAALLEIEDVLDRRPPDLSGGERQRVALARTLAADPDALLLDEPLSSLDAPIRRRLRRELRTLFESLDVPVVYVTHDQRTATALGDRLAVFRDGTVEQVGPPSAVLERPETRFVAGFTGNPNLFEATVAGRSGDATTVRFGERSLRTDGTATPGSAVTVCIHPSRVRLRTPGEAPDGGTTGERPDEGAPGESPGEATTGEAPEATARTTLPGTVADWLNEGADYRVRVDLDGAPATLTATVQPPAFERLGIESGTPVRAEVPPAAVHLIPHESGN